jgi:hypothetical protein
MMTPTDERMNVADPDDLGFSNLPLCREPWENFYILRRGIMPCCYGSPIDVFTADYQEVWNSPKLQEIRSYLSKGKLSPFCLKRLSCPIVQRELAKRNAHSSDPGAPLVTPPRRPLFLRLINKALFGLPRRIYRALNKSR